MQRHVRVPLPSVRAGLRPVTTHDVRRAIIEQHKIGVSPRLCGVHPADFDTLVTFDETACLLTLSGVRIVPCPDTEPGTVEVLKP
jgi:hypothetical protein